MHQPPRTTDVRGRSSSTATTSPPAGAQLRVARRRIGTVFQSAGLLTRRTAAENVALPLEYLGVTAPETKSPRGRPAGPGGACRTGPDHYPFELSGGQRQRVGIARALALRPSVLLSDEATSGLDPETTRSVVALLSELRDDLDLAIVFITHEMDTVRTSPTRWRGWTTAGSSSRAASSTC